MEGLVGQPEVAGADVRNSPSSRFLLALVAGVVAIALSAACGSDVEVREPRGDEEPGFRPSSYPAMAAVDGRVFIWGGSDPTRLYDSFLDDGAMFDPASDSFQHIAEAPFAAPLRFPTAQPVGGKVFVTGISCRSVDVSKVPLDRSPPCIPGTIQAAIYDVGTDSWAAVPLPPDLDALGIEWSDREVASYPAAAVVGASRTTVVVDAGPLSGEYWSFDVESLEWSKLPRPPLELRATTWPLGTSTQGPCVSAGQLLVMDAEYIRGHPSTPVSGQEVRIYALDVDAPATGWRSSEIISTVRDESFSVGCAPTGASLVQGVNLQSWWIDARTLAWSDVEPFLVEIPDGEVFSLDRSVWSGEELVFGDRDWAFGAALDVSTLTWRRTNPWILSGAAIGLNGQLVVNTNGGAEQREVPQFYNGEIAVYQP